jgi:hypothetical protein
MNNKLPLLTPEYLNENNLWDSIWLEEKYPLIFKNNKNE